ncbi:MAG: ribbon-helix-helix domain-containing protein [Stellaceae bacterium]
MSEKPRKRSAVIAGHRTSLSLEEPFWRDLSAVARTRGVSTNALIAAVDRERHGNLSSALRLFVRQCYVSGELGNGVCSHEPLPSAAAAP